VVPSTFKALALDATAVGIGRPYLWGLGAFGQARVDSRDRNSGNCGTQKVSDINHAYEELSDTCTKP
jgi:hypothetical protein